MGATKRTIDEQLSILMQGVEFGDEEIKVVMRNELAERLQKAEGKQPLRVYCGFDPTKPDLHLGHTVPMRKLRQFQELGHQAIFVIGSFTAMVGDPSDKDKARPRLTEEQVMANAKTYTEQAHKILDPQKTEVRYNHEWLAGMKRENFVDLASNFTVQQFLARDNFSKRYESGDPIWLNELIYALLQGYDAMVLEADVQLGGTEQLFNLMAGRKLQEALGREPQIALTLPILVGTDGHMRMSKSAGNTIDIDDPPDEMYGKVMSLPDEAMMNYFQLVTRFGPEEIEKLEAGLSEGTVHPRDVKMMLAREIVEIYHGVDAVEPAEEAFRKVFQEGGVPDEMAEYRVNRGTSLVDVMVDSGTCSSKSEARRLIQQRGVRLDDQVIEGIDTQLEIEQPSVLRVGKRQFVKLIPKS